MNDRQRIDAALQEPIRQPHRTHRIADHNGHDRQTRTGHRIEAHPCCLLHKEPAIGLERCNAARVSFEHPERGKSGCSGRGRQANGVHEAGGLVFQDLDEIVAAANVATAAA